jgi:magnesium transporter
VIRAWLADLDGAREVPAREAVRAAAEREDACVWIDFDGENGVVEAEILAPFGIHPLVLEDMVIDLNRPKVDSYGEYIYLVVHSARWDEDRPALREIDIALGTRYLVTHHEGSTRSIEAAHEVLRRRPELLHGTPARLLHYILDVMVDHYLPIMDRVSERIDALEEDVFDPRLELDHRGVIRLKRGMSALRRIVGPQRDTLLALTRDEFRPIPADLRPYLRDVYDRLARVSDLLDSFRDESATLLELHVTMVSNRLNEVIKRLTVIATVGLPLTVITSYYGMNFELFEYRLPHAWAYVLALLAASAAVTLALLRRKRWM